MNTLDALLSNTYTADIRGQRVSAVTDFVAAIGADSALAAEAAVHLKELDALVEARGEGACAYSTKYREYLHEVLG